MLRGFLHPRNVEKPSHPQIVNKFSEALYYVSISNVMMIFSPYINLRQWLKDIATEKLYQNIQ